MRGVESGYPVFRPRCSGAIGVVEGFLPYDDNSLADVGSAAEGALFNILGLNPAFFLAAFIK